MAAGGRVLFFEEETVTFGVDIFGQVQAAAGPVCGFFGRYHPVGGYIGYTQYHLPMLN